MIFPYWESLRDSGAVFEPLIVITVYGSTDSANIVALIDSGAQRSVFPISIAQRLGIALDRARSVSVVGVGGQESPGYEAPAQLQFDRYHWTTHVIFSPAVDGEALLGQEGFFNFFNVDFLRNKREMNIRRARQ